MIAGNERREDDVSETGRDALDRDEEGEVEALCEELPVEEDCPSTEMRMTMIQKSRLCHLGFSLAQQQQPARLGSEQKFMATQ